MSSKYTERLQVGLTFEQMCFVLNKSWDRNIPMSQDMEKEVISYDTPDL